MVDIIKTIYGFLLENIVGVISLIITTVTFIKVQSVNKAQKKERNLIRELLHLDDANRILFDSYQVLDKVRVNDKENCEEINDLLLDIPQYRGRLDGVLNAISRISDNSKKVSNSKYPIYHEVGYYTDAFLKSVTKNAKIVRICAKRNIRITNMDILQLFSKLAKNGCKIELLTVGPHAPDDKLASFMETMPVPPKSVNHLREQLNTNNQTYKDFIETLDRKIKNRINYFAADNYPPFHFVQVDKKLFFGLTGFNKSKLAYSIVDNRPYLEFKTSDKFAKLILEQFKDLVNTSKTI